MESLLFATFAGDSIHNCSHLGLKASMLTTITPHTYFRAAPNTNVNRRAFASSFEKFRSVRGCSERTDRM